MLRISLRIALCFGLLALSGVSQASEYIVQKGDSIEGVARKFDLVPKELFKANEKALQEAAATCRPSRRSGYFCNSRRANTTWSMIANTLPLGQKLTIPGGGYVYGGSIPTINPAMSAAVAEMIADPTKKRVAIIVDETGSMGGNALALLRLYRETVRAHADKTITGVWLFRDGQVRRVEPDAFEAQYKPQGYVENTYASLLDAQKSNPDILVLITDEPGDDWPADWKLKLTSAVIAHCLPEGGRKGEFSCRHTLKALPQVLYFEGMGEDI